MVNQLSRGFLRLNFDCSKKISLRRCNMSSFEKRRAFSLNSHEEFDSDPGKGGRPVFIEEASEGWLLDSRM